MTRNIRLTRSLAIVRIKRELERDSFPRLQMGLIVALTGASGWLCSFFLLHAGFGSMVVRYPLALCGAYVFFLFLLWLWLRTQAEDYVDLPDPVQGADLFSGSSSAPSPSITSGGGGDFAGGGATGSFDDASAGSISEPGVLSSISDAAGSGLDADELAIPIIAVVLAIGLALASLYVVYLAPTLFAELLFDGVLSYTLYRRLRHADSDHWLGTAFRRTVVPFALTAVFLMAVGAALVAYAPGARSIGEALHHSNTAQ